MGVTQFADITRKDFLRIYLGIQDSSVLDALAVKNGTSFGIDTMFNIECWKQRLNKALLNSWRTVEYFFKKIVQLVISSQPLTIDWREKVYQPIEFTFVFIFMNFKTEIYLNCTD